jgi:hypothetical protein
MLNSRYPNFVHKCPYTAGENIEGNYTHGVENCPIRDSRRPALSSWYYWPDGDYKIEFSASIDGQRVGYFRYYYREKTADYRPW